MLVSGHRPIVVLSDMHVGSTVGLWPEAHQVEGGGEYSGNVYQQWLLQCWHDMLDEVQALEPRPVVILNGDVIQGVNMRDGQLVTNLINIQVEAALELLGPVREAAAVMYKVRGTEWHEGKADEHVELLARTLDCRKDPSSNQWSWWEVYLEIGGGRVGHFAHHIGASSVAWYEATVPLRELLMQLAELSRFYRDKAPNLRLIVRSHRHRYIHVDTPPDLHVAVTPSWQLKTSFAYKKAGSMLPQIGYVIIQFDGEDILVKPRIYELPVLHVEEEAT